MADLAGGVRRCPPDALAELDRLYDQLDAEQSALPGGGRPPCRMCGDCCDFERAGHRLYVTPLELAALVRGAPPAGAVVPLRCPYQDGPACRARRVRPLGCRVFLCRGDQASQNALYEHYHGCLRRLHERHGVPYRYVELISALPAVLGPGL